MTLPDFLSHLEKLDSEATKGPWKYWPYDSTVSKECIVSGVKMGDSPVLDFKNNAAFIAASRDAIPKLVRMVRILSYKDEFGDNDVEYAIKECEQILNQTESK